MSRQIREILDRGIGMRHESSGHYFGLWAKPVKRVSAAKAGYTPAQTYKPPAPAKPKIVLPKYPTTPRPMKTKTSKQTREMRRKTR